MIFLPSLLLSLLTITQSTQSSNQNGHLSKCLHINGSHCTQKKDEGCYYVSRVETEGLVEISGCMNENPSKEEECVVQMGVNGEKKCSDDGRIRLCCCKGDLCSSSWTIPSTETLLSFAHLYYLILSLITASLVWWSPISVLNLSQNFFRKAQFITIPKSFYGIFFGTQGVKILISLATLSFYFWPFLWNCKKTNDEMIFRPNKSIAIFLLPPSLPIAFFPLNHFAYTVYIMYSIQIMCTTGRCIYRSWQLVLFQLLPMAVASQSTAYNLRLSKALLSPGRYCTPTHILPMISLYMSMCSILLEVISSILFLAYHFIPRKKSDDEPLVLLDQSQTPDESTLAETAQPNTPIDVDTLLLQPNPFVLSSYHEEVLSITNRHSLQWVALRVVVSVPSLYVINPQRLIIPPLKTSTVEIRAAQSMEGKSEEHSLLVEWFRFVSGTSCPSRDVSSFWTRPHYRPRSQWKHVVIPIFHEERLPSRILKSQRSKREEKSQSIQCKKPSSE
ncbi:hypothetical protein PRIPAC_71467 [Pristionchus pacificus]|uniref:Uncharacterized protein n=1 Tax=Pristionchus pacificus TaxID=54126 RepID=A0A8R1V600_PRIPA|nr:hypothetical protein PRIPAC_71467 [Pristionchus pacificus]